MTVIEARGLRKEFSVRVKAGWLRRRTRIVTAVDDIDLSVERGETLGYIGPNGAGKSTTLKMLTGVLYPSAGHVRVCGLEPVPQRLRLARRIGVVFGQRSQLWWDLHRTNPRPAGLTEAERPRQLVLRSTNCRSLPPVRIGRLR